MVFNGRTAWLSLVLNILSSDARINVAHLDQLKADVLRYLPEETAQRISASMPYASPPPRQNKIDHFVVLYMENHAADNYFGCMDLPGFDGIKGHSVPKNPDYPSEGIINITCGLAPYVCKSGPGYDTFAGKFAKDGNPHSYPYSKQDDRYSALHGASEGGTAVTMFSPEQIPVKAAIAHNFGVFNKLFSAVPSASSPNHLFTQSATSCGMQANVLYKECGGEDVYFPQPTIYDSLRLHNVSFGLFLNSTCGLDGKPCHGEDPHDPDSASAISTPDVAMKGVARHKDRFFSQTVFYEQASRGTLPSLSWILPPIQACDHPCHDIAKGEGVLKDVYEALRGGPGWNRTLLFVAYDDTGGYYDHMVPPFEGVPADESPCRVPGVHPKCGEQFDFRRLGLRTTSMLISPWVAKGTVFQEPREGPVNTSQFELTSVPSTIKSLFNLSFFLTKRDAWAGSFEELLLDSPRTDTPLHLPDAPLPAKPWDPPPPQDTERTSAGALKDSGPPASHCSSWHGGEETECRGPSHLNLKQLRLIPMFSDMLGIPAPSVSNMTFSEADQWLAKHWREWMSMGSIGTDEQPLSAHIDYV
eukprot:TRINITY_DN96156_c0_g1_i1.p1 TRINITY_DN96156_c0_g1~~TRINITY_DN96156_c0_g1_i1.p1  ORF type:complete len:586 (+),score=45.27 TRINITY_DN96156_c0_g1_i1:99-1856(+)